MGFGKIKRPENTIYRVLAGMGKIPNLALPNKKWLNKFAK
jgi:hypothetical protein